MSKKYQGDSPTWIIWYTGGLITLVFAGVVFWNYQSQNAYKNKTNRELVASCTTDMATQFHIHPHLEIIINGQKRGIPDNIGINAGCMHAIHTHDLNGTLHVEAPEKRDFTLSDFFAVWGKTFSKDQILDSKVDVAHIIKETVNGKESQDYENTVLHDNDQIIISYEEIKNK